MPSYYCHSARKFTGFYYIPREYFFPYFPVRQKSLCCPKDKFSIHTYAKHSYMYNISAFGYRNYYVADYELLISE